LTDCAEAGGFLVQRRSRAGHSRKSRKVAPASSPGRAPDNQTRQEDVHMSERPDGAGKADTDVLEAGKTGCTAHSDTEGLDLDTKHQHLKHGMPMMGQQSYTCAGFILLPSGRRPALQCCLEGLPT